ncbi:hypothetical protein FB45DRAFT_863405 [Roridomyces roridus]|uniref:Uncharacterized protein n=1 Tax=Roridomyces roridus TaxID=1738132 RepID=A0AAD7C5H3_9AGAR|nr:hypothetical protein FB45DRAFT_863405 [Roridomyces roridus]
MAPPIHIGLPDTILPSLEDMLTDPRGYQFDSPDLAADTPPRAHFEEDDDPLDSLDLKEILRRIAQVLPDHGKDRKVLLRRLEKVAENSNLDDTALEISEALTSYGLQDRQQFKIARASIVAAILNFQVHADLASHSSTTSSDTEIEITHQRTPKGAGSSSIAKNKAPKLPPSPESPSPESTDVDRQTLGKSGKAVKFDHLSTASSRNISKPANVRHLPGDVYQHSNSATRQLKTWYADETNTWVLVDQQPGASPPQHPTVSGKVLLLRTDRTPNWVTEGHHKREMAASQR